MWIRIGVLLALAVAVGVTARPVSSTQARTVPCDEIIEHPAFPYVSSTAGYRYRVVLNAISVPPAYLTQVVPTGEHPWAYWRKAGLVIRSGQSVTINVPDEWKGRAAIIWGNGNFGPTSSLRIAGCGADPSVGNAYAGGFYLRSRSACVPLRFRVGSRSATVRFGVGRRCVQGGARS
jgi:hypothetical protein